MSDKRVSRQRRPFLFINKNSSSEVLSRSETDEKRKIQSHVQNERRTKEADRHSEPWIRYSSRLIVDRDVFVTADESRVQQLQEGSRKSLMVARAQSSPARLPRVFPSNNAADPFHSTVVGSNAGNHALLFYTFDFAAKSTFLAEAFAPPSIMLHRSASRHYETTSRRIQRCVEDEMLMNSTLAYGACCQGWALGKIELDKPPEFFIGKTLQAVRRHLAQPQYHMDTWILLSVYTLAVTEFWNGIPAMWSKCPERYARALQADRDSIYTARTHLNALLHLIQRAGGWSAVDPYVMESAILADKYISHSLLKSPVIPLTWDPGHRPPHLSLTELDLKTSTKGDAFHEPEVPLRPELSGLILDMLDFIKVSQKLWLSGDVDAATESWLFLRLQALAYRLLSMKFRGRDECVRVATLVFLNNAIPYHGAQVAARQPLAHLKETIINTGFFTDYGESDQRMLLWCLCTGAMTSEASAEREWFTEKAFQAFSLTPQGLGSQNMVAEMLEAYLFIPSSQEMHLNDLMARLRPYGGM